MMNVATFEGNILNRNTFWQQFNVAIHSKAQLDDTKKLACLRDTLKDGQVKHTLQSLTHDAECYKEGLDCLQKHYDQPHVIYRAHNLAILDALSLEDGNSKDIFLMSPDIICTL